VSESINELAALEERLALEHTSALMTMAAQPQGVFAPVELTRIATIYTVLQAVRSELAAQRSHLGTG
jgi:hypothetical protein